MTPTPPSAQSSTPSTTPSPTLAAARARIAAVRPSAYARTRNALDGAVSGLSPYLTHGLVDLREVLAGVLAWHGQPEAHALEVQHKFVYELGWRAYYQHVWQHRGDGIFQSLHPGPLPDSAYADVLPADIRQGRTGVAAIDQAVQTLYRTGTLHNHARMWLASYVVHLRKVHWRAGADWLYAHLLDGDLASNHLSWQWVAGTASSKPYLFNAENVARYAPSHWHSLGSVIDTSYEALDLIARQPQAAPGPAGAYPQATAAAQTLLWPTDPAPSEPPLLDAPPHPLGCTAPLAAAVSDRTVWLVHPWALGAPPADLPADALVVGVFEAGFHRRWPWAEQRWRFVGQRMAELATARWHGDAEAIGGALAAARQVRSVPTPHLPAMAMWARCGKTPSALAPLSAPLFPAVARRCDSFSQWWRQTTRGLQSADDLLRANLQSGD